MSKDDDQTPPRYRKHFFICQGKTCTERLEKMGSSSEEAKKFFKSCIKDAGLKGEVRACVASCLDHCDGGPNILVYPEGRWHTDVSPKDWQKIFKAETE